MSETPRETCESAVESETGGGDPAAGVFAALHDRPTPELDSHRLWRRIEARLPTRGLAAGSGRSRAAPASLPWALAAAALFVIALAAWLATSPGDEQADAGQFVVLVPPDAAVIPPELAATARPGEVVLDVRLVRGFDGAPPDDVSAARALGVGGADAIGDVRARIESSLPFEDYGIVGAWRGSVAASAGLDVELAAGYRLATGAVATPEEPSAVLRLEDMRLEGVGGPVSGDMTLEPGRVYMLGVPAGDGEPDLILVLRALPAEGRR